MHWEVWESWGADAWVVQVLRYGYRVPFQSRPPLSHVPIPLPSYSPNSIRGLALSDAVSALVEKEAIEVAPPSLGFYSRLFVTPKVTGVWRPGINLSRLNGWLELSSFHMEIAPSVLQSLRPGDWMVSLDLQDAYLQVPVHPASRRYLRFCVGNAVYQFRALCFGLSSAPQVFTRVMASVSSIMHCHGFCLLRYLDDWLVLSSTFQELVRARDFLLRLCRLLGIIVNPSKSSLVPTQTLDYLGMMLVTSPLRVFPNLKRIQKFSLLLQDFLSDRLHPVSVWRSLLGMMSSMSAIVPGSRLRMRSLQLRLNAAGPLLLDRDLVSWDVGCLRDLRWWSDDSHLLVGLPLGEDHPDLFLFSDASDQGWGAALGDLHLSGFVVSPLLVLFDQPARAIGHPLRGSGFSASPQGSVCSHVFRQLHGFGLPPEAGGHSLIFPECGGSGTPSPLRVSISSSSSSVHSRPSECPGGFTQLPLSSPQLRMDFVSSGSVRAPASVASHHQPLHDVAEPSPAGVFLAHVRPTVSRHGCYVAVVGRAAGLCLPSVQSSSSSIGEGSGFQGPGADIGSSFLSSAPLVPGPSGAVSGDPPLPATKEGSSQTATLSSLPPESVRASADCLSYIRRSALQAGFSDAVASQLTHCQRCSTRVNYQAKWVVYRSCCHRHGHSVSRPTVAKVADFLLYLRRSLSLSYSSIASYRSMLSGVFHFILPELSSHFVLHDLLRSFRLERPLSSSRVPPWDLLVVFQFLRGPPFEPLASASLRALTQKVLFLVSLATARRVGELQGVSREVSFSGSDAYLSYLPGFRAKTESAVNQLPRSFCVRSLKDFVGDLPDELLLFPVRALRTYLARTSSLASRPRTLFVSPRSPSRSLSKNALSFFSRCHFWCLLVLLLFCFFF